MKYLEYLSVTVRIAKAEKASTFALKDLFFTRSDTTRRNLVRKANIPLSTVARVYAIAADYDAMSKSCVEKQIVRAINCMREEYEFDGRIYEWTKERFYKLAYSKVIDENPWLRQFSC
jgi:hypothetical protein